DGSADSMHRPRNGGRSSLPPWPRAASPRTPARRRTDMKLYMYEDVDDLTTAYHHYGAAVVITDQDPSALIDAKRREGRRDEAEDLAAIPAPDHVIDVPGETVEPVFIFPDARRCGHAHRPVHHRRTRRSRAAKPEQRPQGSDEGEQRDQPPRLQGRR